MNPRRIVRTALVGGPFLIVGAALVYLSGEGGSYDRTWKGIRWFFDTVSPNLKSKIDWSVSLYQINDTLRKLAHLVLYSSIAWTGMRLVPGPIDSKLGKRVLVGLGGAVLMMAADIAARLLADTRHVRTSHFVWNAAGLALGIGAWVARWGIRQLALWAWEKSNLDADTPSDSGQSPENTPDPDPSGSEPDRTAEH